MLGRLAAPCTRSVIGGKILRAFRKLTFLTHRRVKNGVDQRFNPLLCHRSKLNGISLQSPLQLQAIHQRQHACTSSINTSLTSIIDENPAFHTPEQGPRAIRYEARHSGAGLYACTHQLHITALSISDANSALWIPTGCRFSHHLAALNLISPLITVTTYKKASPWGGPIR